MTEIDYFYSLLSPYTYLAGDGLEQIAEHRGATINYRPVNFLKILPETGGQPVPKRHPFRQVYRLQELTRISARAGMAFNLQPAYWPVDVAEASVLVIAAGHAGADIGAVSRAFLAAVWAGERDISDAGTIAEVLAQAGVDQASLAPGLAAAHEEYEANTALAFDRGVFGAPFYIVGDERFWGQDRLDYLDWHLGGRGAGG